MREFVREMGKKDAPGIEPGLPEDLSINQNPES